MKLLETIITATIFYTIILILPAFINPYSKEANMLQGFSLLFTVILPVLWCLYTVNYVSRLELDQDTDDYWGTEAWHGKSGNHDFCETNYYYYKHIIEFHNTWSSLPVIFYGTVGTYYTRRYATLEGRFPCAFIAIGGVGVGSTLFHGALRSWGQILDEVPMLFIIFAFAYCHLEPKEKPCYYPWLPVALVISCFTFVAGYLFYYFYAFFLVGFSAGVGILLIYGVSIYGTSSKLSKRIFVFGVLALLTGFLCWICDDQYCKYISHLNLHIGWHIFTGLGGYLFGLFQVSLRAKALKKRAILVMPWFCRDPSRGGWDVYGMEIVTKYVYDRGEMVESLSFTIRKNGCPEFFLPYVALK
jgi:dihydroceramidase